MSVGKNSGYLRNNKSDLVYSYSMMGDIMNVKGGQGECVEES